MVRNQEPLSDSPVPAHVSVTRAMPAYEVDARPRTVHPWRGWGTRSCSTVGPQRTRQEQHVDEADAEVQLEDEPGGSAGQQSAGVRCPSAW